MKVFGDRPNPYWPKNRIELRTPCFPAPKLAFIIGVLVRIFKMPVQNIIYKMFARVDLAT